MKQVLHSKSAKTLTRWQKQTKLLLISGAVSYTHLYLDMREKYEDDFKAGMGAEAIKELLCEIDVDAVSYTHLDVYKRQATDF